MTEEFLHYIWQYRLFDNRKAHEEPVRLDVIHPGIKNTDAGPDFFNARIRMGRTVWAGNVEIHLKSSDWFNHGHQHDEAYNNIILHVVYFHDMDIRRQDGEIIPELELKGLIDENLLARYHEIEESLETVPCSKMITDVSNIVVREWLSRLFVEKMEEKAVAIMELLNHNMMDWEQVFYEWLAYGFGLKVNAEAMMMVARNTHIKLIAHEKESVFRLEAFLLGQAGLLEGKISDEYPKSLKKEYNYLRKKYSLTPIRRYIWKYARMRPAGFPDIRLSQLACLLHRSGTPFARMLGMDFDEEMEFLNELTASGYWNEHYRIDKKSPGKVKRFGRSAAEKLMINSVVPFMMLYGRERNLGDLVEKAISWAEKLPPEENNVVRSWRKLGIEPESALETQALLYLKKSFCDRKRCLHCSIGSAIIRKS